MRAMLKSGALLVLAGALMLGTACTKKPPKTEPSVQPTPVATPVPSVVTNERPTPETTPTTKVEELPGDVADINKKGYLKDVFFDFDKSDIRPDQRDSLAADAEWLKKWGTVKIRVEGHCDERGTAQYNLALGDRRANAVKEYLGSLGVDASRVETISYGKERPFAQGHDESAWAQNRRGHFVATAR